MVKPSGNFNIKTLSGGQLAHVFEGGHWRGERIRLHPFKAEYLINGDADDNIDITDYSAEQKVLLVLKYGFPVFGAEARLQYPEFFPESGNECPF